MAVTITGSKKTTKSKGGKKTTVKKTIPSSCVKKYKRPYLITNLQFRLTLVIFACSDSTSSENGLIEFREHMWFSFLAPPPDVQLSLAASYCSQRPIATPINVATA